MSADFKRVSVRKSASALPTLAPPRQRWLEITLFAACLITVPLLVAVIGLGLYRSEAALAEAKQAQHRAKKWSEAYRDVLEQERHNAQTLTRDLAAARQEIGILTATARTAAREAIQQAERAAAYQESLARQRARLQELAQQLAARRDAAPDNPEAGRLMARASRLLDQGNIGVARVVLERAAEMGSASALFALAETYDPAMLSAWRTFGTQGDVRKARELYAKAFAGGVREAKERLNGSRQ
jgi:hypothetical protein